MPHKNLPIIFFFSFLGLMSLMFFSLLWYFFKPLLLAVLIAVFSYPMYRWFEQKFCGKKNIAALVSIFLLITFVVAPLFVLGVFFVQDSLILYNDAQSLVKPALRFLQELPQKTQPFLPEVIQQNLEMIDWKVALIGMVKSAGAFVFEQAGRFTGNLVRVIVDALILVFALFYLYIDGPRWAEKVMKCSPLSDADEKLFFEKFIETAKATLLGTVVIGAIQGGLGSVAFALLGIKAPFFWGAVMMVLSIIPGLGASMVWFPASVLLFIQGKVVAAIILFAFGILLIGLVDDLLRSLIVGKRSHIHPLIVLLSTLGGILMFGFVGFILGPIIASLFFASLKLYEERYT